jgi:ribosome-binding protein aMBF1 (putative translation factor)
MRGNLENMNLREYLFYNRITVKEFSEKIEYSRTHLSAIIHGRLKPSKRLAKQIERETNGEVTVKELMEGGGER